VSPAQAQLAELVEIVERFSERRALRLLQDEDTEYQLTKLMGYWEGWRDAAVGRITVQQMVMIERGWQLTVACRELLQAEDEEANDDAAE